MNVTCHLIHWIHSYLTERLEYVEFNHVKYNYNVPSTGAPQGCVLSLLLFTLYTNDCICERENCTRIKYASDNIVNNVENNYLLPVVKSTSE